jgi:hypothetical protein
MVNRKETASNVVITVGEEEVVVETFSYGKDINMEAVYGSGRPLPDGIAIHEISYQGEFSCVGNRLDLESKFFDEHGLPKELDAITVTHLNGDASGVQEVYVNTEGYEFQVGETTQTRFGFIAMRKLGPGGRVDSQPNL